MNSAYYSSNYNKSTTTNPMSSNYGETITVSNWPDSMVMPIYPVPFNGEFWDWLYGQVFRKAMSKRKREKIRNLVAWAQRLRTRNREYRSRPAESGTDNE